MAEENKLLSSEELHQLKSKGYESRGAGFTKDNKFVSNKEIDAVVSQIREASPFKLIEKRLDKIEKDLFDVYDHVTTPDPIMDNLPKRVEFLEQDVFQLLDNATKPDEASENPVEKEALAKLSSIADGMGEIATGLATLQKQLSGVQAAKKEIGRAHV